MPRMGGFELSFYLPFDRACVYDELLVHPRRRYPLGASPNVAFSILRPGYDPDNEVRPLARRWPPARQPQPHLDDGGARARGRAAQLSVGCVRQVSFAAPFFGETVSELTVAARGAPEGEEGRSEVVWRQLDSATRLNLLGDGRHLPEFGVQLEDGPHGTLVTLRYNFARAEMQGPLCFLVGCMPSLLKWHLHASIASVWHLEMCRRGHVPCKRPFRQMSADVSLEESIRSKARTPRER